MEFGTSRNRGVMGFWKFSLKSPSVQFISRNLKPKRTRNPNKRRKVAWGALEPSLASTASFWRERNRKRKWNPNNLFYINLLIIRKREREREGGGENICEHIGNQISLCFLGAHRAPPSSFSRKFLYFLGELLRLLSAGWFSGSWKPVL